LKPVLAEAEWPPRQVRAAASGPPLLEAAKASGCVVVEARELLFERLCTCATAWTGKAALRRRLTEVYLRDAAEVQGSPVLFIDNQRGSRPASRSSDNHWGTLQ